MLTKIQIKKNIETLPEEISLDDMIDRLILLDKIENGLQQSENGELISNEKVKIEAQTWFK